MSPSNKLSSCSIRPATNNDQEFVRNLNERCYRDVIIEQFGIWDDEVQKFRFERKWNSLKYQLILQNQTIAGAFSFERKEDHYFLAEMIIDPSFQNKKLGTSLIQDLLQKCKKDLLPLRLQVLKKNRAKSLYDKLGFNQTGETDTHFLMEHLGG